MNCPQAQERMMDVLYGEELQARACFDFFGHLTGCEACKAEYLELIETRELLSEWEVKESFTASTPRAARKLPFPAGRPSSWWTLAQRVAAVVLMLVGAVTLLDLSGVRLFETGVAGEELKQVVADEYRANLPELLEAVQAVLDEKIEEDDQRIVGAILGSYEDWAADQKSYLTTAITDHQSHVYERLDTLEAGLKRVRAE